jgi:hypothetical protein
MLVKPVLSLSGLQCVSLPGVPGPLVRGLQLRDRDGCSEAEKLKKYIDVTAFVHLNTATQPPSLLCCSPPTTHNR